MGDKVNKEIQEQLNRSQRGDVVLLPSGEFQGPFIVANPCTIEGKNTTLWTKSGPALIIESKDVIVKDLRIEVTKPPTLPDDFICLTSKSRDSQFYSVEIIGDVRGIAKEEEPFFIPKLLNLGEFKGGQLSFCEFEITIPVDAELISCITDVTVSPSKLKAGINRITITMDHIDNGMLIYGELLIISKFIRSICISGCASKNAVGYKTNELLYVPNRYSENKRILDNKCNVVHNVLVPYKEETQAFVLMKGQKALLSEHLDNRVMIQMTQQGAVSKELDPYIFLSNENDKVTDELNLVFFGNKESPCKAVIYHEEDNKTMEVDLNRIPAQIKKVTVVYSVYGDDRNDNFSQIVSPTVVITSKGKKKVCFPLKDLTNEKTVVGIELYLYKNQWKINAVGSGYIDGLRKLCINFGLDVI